MNMEVENLDKSRTQMRRGVLEMCVLSILSADEVYPSDIITRLKDAELIVVEGTLYPLLTRLKNSGFLQYRWQESESGPPRKYFYITDEGKVFLDGLVESWDSLVESVQNIIKSDKIYE